MRLAKATFWMCLGNQHLLLNLNAGLPQSILHLRSGCNAACNTHNHHSSCSRLLSLSLIACVSHTSLRRECYVCFVGCVQGIDPEIRTYNTVIIACNMSSQAQEALRVYKRMLAVGAQPTATTYTALISAYGKIGQLERALQIFQVSCRRAHHHRKIHAPFKLSHPCSTHGVSPHVLYMASM